jgi:hypothetical protein
MDRGPIRLDDAPVAALAAPAGVERRLHRPVGHILRQRPGEASDVRPLQGLRAVDRAMPSRRAISCVDTQENVSRIISRASRIQSAPLASILLWGCQRDDLIRPTAALANPQMTPVGIIPLWGARSSRNRGAASSGNWGQLPQESAPVFGTWTMPLMTRRLSVLHARAGS